MNFRSKCLIFVSIKVLLSIFPISCQDLTLTFLHINDFHARYEQITSESGSKECNEKAEICMAGYARLIQAVRDLKSIHYVDNPIFINVGDIFQGTIWYGFLKWNVTQAMFNLEVPDIMTLGNHEFDNGIENLASFLDYVRWPILVANIDVKEEPLLMNQNKIQGTLVKKINGIQVGFIGVMYDKTPLHTKTGKVEFFDSIETVRNEAKILHDKGIKIIVVVSHCGIDIEQAMAEEAGEHIDIIIGGHSHTLLWPSGKKYPGPDNIEGEYPLVIRPIKFPNRGILIVTSYCHGRVLGLIKTKFNVDGEIVAWKPDPEYLDANIPEDHQIKREILKWRSEVDKYADREIGDTKVVLSGKKCRFGECTLGNFLAHIMQQHYIKVYPENIILGIIQAGAIQGNLDPGKITEGDLMRVYPFESYVMSFELEGRYIRQSLERGALLGRKDRYNFLQLAGIKVTYDMQRDEFDRITEVLVDTGKDGSTIWKSLDDSTIYKIATLSFLANGGDGFKEIAQYQQYSEVGPDDRDAFRDYLKKNSPIDFILEDLTTVHNCPICDKNKRS